MEPSRHADPLEEALSHGSQRVAQIASLAAAMAQVTIHRRALHDARTAARDDHRATQLLSHQERLLREETRMTWAPAHDRAWLAHADVIQAGRAWAGAARDAAADPAAAAAMRKCEDRLRGLHPHAMARYDRLRADGLGPLDAMQQAAPLFIRSPDVRVGEPAATRPALAASGAPDDHPQAEEPPADTGPDPAETRGERIAERLQARARTAGRPPLGRDEMAMVLEAATNLPEQSIARITRHVADPQQPHAPAPARSPASLTADSFPHGPAEAVRASARSHTARPLAVMPTPGVAHRPGPPA